MRRRRVLRASAAALGGAAATIVGLTATDEARAETALSLAIGGDSTTLGPDATVTAVRLSLDVEWRYDLPDTAAPETVVIEIAAGEESLSVVASAETATLFTDADGTESFDVGLIEEGALSASALAPANGSRETSVTVEARLRVEDASGAVLARETTSDTAPVTVERDAPAAEYGAVGGSGALTITTGSGE